MLPESLEFLKKKFGKKSSNSKNEGSYSTLGSLGFNSGTYFVEQLETAGYEYCKYCGHKIFSYESRCSYCGGPPPKNEDLSRQDVDPQIGTVTWNSMSYERRL